jgi:hypothetical protein
MFRVFGIEFDFTLLKNQIQKIAEVMKAKITILVMLMSILFGSLEASGQSARRGETRESSRKSTPAVKSETTRAPRQTQRSASRASHATSNGKAVSPSTSKPVRNANRADDQRLKSISPTGNSRSDYGRSNRTEHIGKTYKNPRGTLPGSQDQQPRHSTSKTYGTATTHGHARTIYHEHRYYPRSSVNIHVHPRMHYGQYKVLYYPGHSEIVWSRSMHRYYAGIYPGYSWNYTWGYRVKTLSVFDARYSIGEITRVYGRVYGTWLNRETDDLLLFFGGEFPHQQFTIVIPGNLARRYSWRPERYFLGQHIVATGLITAYDGIPEMVIKRKRQLDVY